jgi:hypothetical protein
MGGKKPPKLSTFSYFSLWFKNILPHTTLGTHGRVIRPPPPEILGQKLSKLSKRFRCTVYTFGVKV